MEPHLPVLLEGYAARRTEVQLQSPPAASASLLKQREAVAHTWKFEPLPDW